MQATDDAHPYTWLWENSDWADFTVDVLPAEAGPDTAPLYTLKLQSVVLAAASPGHFRRHCSRLRAKSREDGAGKGAEPGHARVGTKRRAPDTADGEPQGADVPAEQEPAYRLLLLHEEPEGVPKAVLCHLYTGALPDDTEQLIWMLRRADYLDLAVTVHAALRKLISAGSKQLTLQHAALLHSLPDLQCGMRQGGAIDQLVAAAAGWAAAPAAPAAPAADGAAPARAVQVAMEAAPAAAAALADMPAQAEAAAPAPASATTAAALLQQLIDSLLLAHLPSAPAIVTDAALLAQFTQLPLALVKRWVELDKYEVDSGNTLAVLFTAWHDAQPEPPSEQQCKQLSDMLPLRATTYPFHSQALQHLKWWRREPGLLTQHMLSALRPQFQDLKAYWHECARGVDLAPRATALKKHTWSLTPGQIQKLWDDKYITMPGVYFAGYYLGLELSLKHHENDKDQNGPLFLGLFQTGVWPNALAQHTSLAHQPADLIHSQIRWQEPDGFQWEGFWWDQWGWSYLDEQQYNFTSLAALQSKLSPPAFKLDCEFALSQGMDASAPGR